MRRQALQICRVAGAEEHQDVRATSLETLRQMVRAGTGITFIPELAIQKSESDICCISFSPPAPSRNIGLVWRKTTTGAVLVSRLNDLVKTAPD